MKTIILPTAAILLLCFCSSCGTTKYVPVETTKIEYRDQLVRDSIFSYDSVFVKQITDTVFFERYKYLYKDKIIRDSIFKTDTTRVPYPVEVVKEVKAPLTSWQNFQVWCGKILLVIALLVGLYFMLKLKKRLF
ncbi:MAG: hypothetical protein LBV41_12810 [Cytophagaceae bacterium]|jgi:hypothetical protein|nr:hypothetical protein [Cytophagaceae bacterium]